MRLTKSSPILKTEDYSADTIAVKVGAVKSVETKTTEFGDRNLLNFEDDKGEGKAVFLNQSSIDKLIDAYGDETSNWTGKKISIICKKGSGKNKQKMLLVGPAN